MVLPRVTKTPVNSSGRNSPPRFLDQGPCSLTLVQQKSVFPGDTQRPSPHLKAVALRTPVHPDWMHWAPQGPRPQIGPHQCLHHSQFWLLAPIPQIGKLRPESVGWAPRARANSARLAQSCLAALMTKFQDDLGFGWECAGGH